MLEFGVMRAIGLSISQLISILSMEQFLTVGFGFGLGTIYGVIVSRVFLPFFTDKSESGGSCTWF